jgi:hypothetical protein
MAAKKKRKGAAPARKPKKRAGRPVKKKKARTKPKVRPAANILDNTQQPFRAEALPPPYRPMTDENTPPPPFRSSQPSSMHWGSSDDSAPWMWQQNRNAALLATSGAVEPPAATLDDPVSPIPDVGASDPNALHAEMITQIEALDREIDSLLEQQRRGIGHNNPPEPIELAPPLSAKELGEIKKAMAVLKKEPPAPTALSAKAEAAVALLMKFGDRLRPLARATMAYVGKQADNFVTEAVKEAGKRIAQSPLWLPIIYKLPALADIALQWLQSLGPH